MGFHKEDRLEIPLVLHHPIGLKSVYPVTENVGIQKQEAPIWKGFQPKIH